MGEAMKACGGVFLTSAPVTIEWSASRASRFTPRKGPLIRIEQEVAWTPESVWAIRRRENFLPYRDSNSDPSVVQPVAIPAEPPRLSPLTCLQEDPGIVEASAVNMKVVTS
jgi:hypothetical protein